METGNQILEVSSSDEADSDGCRSFGSKGSLDSDPGELTLKKEPFSLAVKDQGSSLLPMPPLNSRLKPLSQLDVL